VQRIRVIENHGRALMRTWKDAARDTLALRSDAARDRGAVRVFVLSRTPDERESGNFTWTSGRGSAMFSSASMLDPWMLALAAVAGLACGFLNTVASSGSAVSLPILMMMGLDPITANATNRLPVLIGAISATGSFQRQRAIPWRLALQVSIPVTVGAAIGAGFAEVLPGRDMGLMITAAVLVALVLLFTKLKQAIESVQSRPLRFGTREWLWFLLIGTWLGFIVLDGATYLLLALVLAVGTPLLGANAIKSVALVPTSLVAVAMFAIKGNLDWTLGMAMAAGSIAGGLLGVRLAVSENARRWVFRLLAVVILGEVAHLGMHYFAQTV
jgi:uncharacterized membrane protein YfcA